MQICFIIQNQTDYKRKCNVSTKTVFRHHQVASGSIVLGTHNIAAYIKF